MGQYDGVYVDGEWLTPEGGAEEVVVNPATEEPIGSVSVGGKPELEAALDAARRAFDDGPWPRLPQAERTARMQRLYDELLARKEGFIDLLVAEAGATQMLANVAHFDLPMAHFAWALDATRRRPDVLPLETAVMPGPGGTGTVATGVVVREPVGVVGAITAYNYPLVLNLAKIVPALLMGNTIVLKPSPFTPLVTLLLADVAHSVGAPGGVLNIVTGGVEVGHGLTSDDRVDLVAFTGSEAVGSAVMTQSAPTIKKVLLELGGKSALIVCDDANVDEAAAGAVYNFTAQAGQGCGALSRLLVHASVKERFIETVKAMLESLTVGDPSDPSVTMGPLIRASQRAKVEGMVGDALADGATVITGGRRPEHLTRGYFYEPTLLTDVDNRDPIAQEEIFGPVSIVIGFDTDDEAIALANASRYGLSGGVFSGDAGRAFDLARRIRTGSVRVNGGSGIEAPFGGYKRSGIGREYGDVGLDEYTEVKSITFRSR
jgi:acyl-CoA reductase-like NAD-dependent aldehyde dehydrogenase